MHDVWKLSIQLTRHPFACAHPAALTVWCYVYDSHDSTSIQPTKHPRLCKTVRVLRCTWGYSGYFHVWLLEPKILPGFRKGTYWRQGHTMIGSALCWLQSILIQILWINPEDQCPSHSWFPKASLFPHCLTPKGRVRVTPTSVSSRDLRIREEQGQKYIVQWGSILQNITNKTSINKRNIDLSR
jgi:hypothetical protein